MRLSFADDFLDLPRSLTFAVPHEGKTAYEEIPQSLYCAAYLGKIQTAMFFYDGIKQFIKEVGYAVEAVVSDHLENSKRWS